jgi:hypothetical protein
MLQDPELTLPRDFPADGLDRPEQEQDACLNAQRPAHQKRASFEHVRGVPANQHYTRHY